MAQARSTIQRGVRLRNACMVAVLCSAAGHASTPVKPDQCIVSDRAIGCLSERATIELSTPHKDPGVVRELVEQKIGSGQCRLFGYGERVYLVAAKGTERTAVRRIGDRATYWLPASWTRPAADCEANASSASLHAKLGMPDPERTQQDEGLADRADAFDGDRDADGADDRSGDAGADDADDRRRFARPRDFRRIAREDDDRRALDDRETYRRFARTDENRYGSDESPADDAPPYRRNAFVPLPSASYAHRLPLRRSAHPARCVFKPVMSDADLDACQMLER